MSPKLAVVVGICLLLELTQPSPAQDRYPRGELFGGFSFLPANGMDFPRKNSLGFQASIAGNITRGFGIVADFGGHYSKTSDLGPGFPGITANSSVHEYMAGPRFTWRSDRFTLFFHGLAGGARGRTDLRGFSDGHFAWGGGGGLDINLGDRIAIRAIQLDYVGSFVDILEHNARLGIGIVFKFCE
jgi:hypothetical protein